MEFQSIGTIHSPFTERRGMPIQPTGAPDTRGQVEVLPEYAAGLQDLAGFSHIYLIYHFHQSQGCDLLTTPFMDDTRRGVFATRAPRRPNAIGLSVVALEKVEGNVLHIRGVDVVDGTPLLDIKPHVKDFDTPAPPLKFGWLEDGGRLARRRKADDRFVDADYGGTEE